MPSREDSTIETRTQLLRVLSASLSLELDGGSDEEAIHRALSYVSDDELVTRLITLANIDPRRSTPPAGGEDTREPQLAVGEKIAGVFRIEAFLDRGGMGEVYRAIDELLDVSVALKLIRPSIAADPNNLRRFKREVLLARSVTHPNVCRIHHLGWDERRNLAYLTMEFLTGQTLRNRIRAEDPLGSEAALPIVRQLADGLDAAHRAGVVHRDFKTDNVMLVPSPDGERAVILDFGLARELERHAGTTQETGCGAVGTPAYMSPEQVTNGELTSASDLYALGVVLFEMVTGRLPFLRRSPLETALAQVADAPPSPREFAEIEAHWERAILRLLAKDPADRYESAADVVLALENRSNGRAQVAYFLPAERDEFVGRTVELGAIASRLEGTSPAYNPTRLLTLRGTGGTGKTRLAQRYGWSSLEVWDGGVWFCDLSEAKGVDGIVRAVATSLDVPLGREDPVVQLGHAITGRGRCLVILDNFDTVVAHAGMTLGRWLDHAANARFLVTSRESLGLAGETVVDLGPLPPKTDGVELLVARVRRNRPGFQVDEFNRDLVMSIAHLLDGLPLAIELAASRLRLLSLHQIRDRLSDPFSLLTRPGSDRHSTLQGVLRSSWESLTSGERFVLLQASVFEGGFTIEAAEAVIDTPQRDSALHLIDSLEALIDKSFLRVTTTPEGSRLTMLSIVREYVHRQSKDDVMDHTRESAEERHANYYSTFGSTEFLDTMNGHGGARQRSALSQELGNLGKACRWALAARAERTAVPTFVAASEAYELKGTFAAAIDLGHQVLVIASEPKGRCAVLLSMARAEQLAGRTDEALGHAASGLALQSPDGDRTLQARLSNCVGSLYCDRGELDEAQRHFDAALAVARSERLRRLEGIALRGIGRVHQQRGEPDHAVRCVEEALAIDREVGDLRNEAASLSALAMLRNDGGRVEKAREIYEACLAIHRSLADRNAEAIALGNIGVLAAEQGDWDVAQASYEAALQVHRETGNRSVEGVLLGNLGALQGQLGRTEVARDLCHQSIAIAMEVGNRPFECFIRTRLAAIEHDHGAGDEALQLYRSVLSIAQEIGDQGAAGAILSSLGNLSAEDGLSEEAHRHYQMALELVRKAGDRYTEGLVLGNLGALHLAEGAPEEALQCFKAALGIHREFGTGWLEGVILCGLGSATAAGGDSARASQYFQEGTTILSAGGSPLDLARSLCSVAAFEIDQGKYPTAFQILEDAERIANELNVLPGSKLAKEIHRLRLRLSEVDGKG